ncbi:MAG: serine/threonine protein kinase [Cyanobacteria bacterium]|nr:serine/threonine protein kinase [Cyanobacteriota bacterium]
MPCAANLAFQDEARVTSKLSHQSIVRILDFGPTGSGSPYMVLEYIDKAVSLQQFILDNGPLSNKQAVEIFSRVADALAYAHNVGIYHRDLKPSNVLLYRTDSESTFVKLIDFGIAKVNDQIQDITGLQATLVGTPAYMSPDQAAPASGFVHCNRALRIPQRVFKRPRKTWLGELG